VFGAVAAIVLEASDIVDGDAEGAECSGPKYQLDCDCDRD
jgi:hypothetical protein